MRCSKCNTDNPDRAKFCIECGTALQNRCANCSFDNLARAKFCAECGTPLTRASQTAQTPDQNEADTADPVLITTLPMAHGGAYGPTCPLAR